MSNQYNLKVIQFIPYDNNIHKGYAKLLLKVLKRINVSFKRTYSIKTLTNVLFLHKPDILFLHCHDEYGETREVEYLTWKVQNILPDCLILLTVNDIDYISENPWKYKYDILLDFAQAGSWFLSIVKLCLDSDLKRNKKEIVQKLRKYSLVVN
jgi:hypothetical protein